MTARGYSIALDSGQAADHDEAKERTAQRFDLLKVILADKRMTVATLKVAVYLLMIKYNDYTGQCNPGVPTIAEATALDQRSVRRALVTLRNVLEYVCYQENPGGSYEDHSGRRRGYSNYYEFRFPKPCLNGQGTNGTSKTNPDPTVRNPDLPDQPTLTGEEIEPCLTGQPNNNRNNHPEHPNISNVPLPPVADTLRCPKGSGSKNEEGKKERKQTSEWSKPEARATLECIEKGIAYVKAIDHDARLEVIAQYDRLLDHIRRANPGHKVDKISAYVGRPKLRDFSSNAGVAA